MTQNYWICHTCGALKDCPPQLSLQAELLDLIKLMPDAQVDAILAFVAMLREARQLSRGNAAASPPPSAAPGQEEK